MGIWDVSAALASTVERVSAEAVARPQVGCGGDGGGIVSIAEMEKQAILGTIRPFKGDKLLGIGTTTLYRKLKEYGVTESAGD